MKYISWLLPLLLCCTCSIGQQQLTEEKAEKMLLYQRDNGGWPQYKGDATDYRLDISEKWKAQLIADKSRLDATIDDRSTTLEINYLLETYSSTKNKTYLKAAERGIAYLLEAQNPAGGWPQFYPDSSSYRINITYNDNAMIDVLWIIKHLAEDEGFFKPLDAILKTQAKTALQKGIECILQTQVVENGQLTVWCAQHDSKTLLPAKARAFEPASLSGAESVGITRFLMSIDEPSEAIKNAVEAAVKWFDQAKIVGWDVKITNAPSRDRILVKDDNSTIWARFYELETGQPIFTGRDGIIRYSLAEIERERRGGYAFYGTWPQKLLKKDYPAWVDKWQQ